MYNMMYITRLCQISCATIQHFKGSMKKFVTLEVSPSSETNYVVAHWTGQLPLSKIIGNNIRFHDKTFISSFSFTNVKIRQNWFCCIPDNQKFTLIFAFYSLITPTMSKNISNLRVLCFNVCQFPM